MHRPFTLILVDNFPKIYGTPIRPPPTHPRTRKPDRVRQPRWKLKSVWNCSESLHQNFSGLNSCLTLLSVKAQPLPPWPETHPIWSLFDTLPVHLMASREIFWHLPPYSLKVHSRRAFKTNLRAFLRTSFYPQGGIRVKSATWKQLISKKISRTNGLTPQLNLDSTGIKQLCHFKPMLGCLSTL